MVSQPRHARQPEEARAGVVAEAIRRDRLIVVLRRIEPRRRLVELVEELADAGARIFEITFDASDAAEDLAACRSAVAPRADVHVGAGTIRDVGRLSLAVEAGAAFVVAPTLDADVVAEAVRLEVPVVPGAFTPTEVDRAWRLGATFVKLFPGSALGPSFVRELHGPLPEVETIVTGGIDATNGPAFLDAGAVAVGIGSALVHATTAERRSLLASIRGRRS